MTRITIDLSESEYQVFLNAASALGIRNPAAFARAVLLERAGEILGAPDSSPGTASSGAERTANDVGAEHYGKYEDVDEMPSGSILAKPSFTMGAGGEAALGPLFLMEKMAEGWNDETADWRYAMINADGSTFGVTGGQNSDGMTFCHECHTAGRDADYLLFLPEEFRRQ